MSFPTPMLVQEILTSDIHCGEVSFPPLGWILGLLQEFSLLFLNAGISIFEHSVRDASSYVDISLYVQAQLWMDSVEIRQLSSAKVTTTRS